MSLSELALILYLGFGGEDNPERVEINGALGDVIVIPAGVGHRLFDDFHSGFEMVGSYPKGKQWDMCYGKEDKEKKIQGISDLGWFKKDPLYGDEGPALDMGT